MNSIPRPASGGRNGDYPAGKFIGDQLSCVLSDFARTMLTDFPIQSILNELVLRIVELLPITAAGVTLISPSTKPHYVAASSDEAMHYEELQTELGEGPCLVTYQTGEAVTIPDLSVDKHFKKFTPRALAAGLGAVFTFPLRHEDQQLGALDLYRNTPGALSDDEMDIAQTMADVTTAYLLNAQARAELRSQSERSLAVSMRDSLTGLANRALLIQRIEHALQRSSRSKQSIAVLFIDLDQFKRVNDTFNHQVGDELLVAVAERLGVLIRPGDTLARLSGDEFVVVCEDFDDVAEVQVIAARLVEKLAEPFKLPSGAISISISVGIECGPSTDADPETLLNRADIAMYSAKRRGGNDFEVFDIQEQVHINLALQLQEDVGHAVAKGQVRLMYQPIVRTSDGSVVGAEALLRWDHPTRGPIEPDVLIPLAEYTGAIIEVGQWVLQRACLDRQRWQDVNSVDFVISVNVSPIQLLAPDFVEGVTKILQNTDTAGRYVCLEVTESALVHDAAQAVVILNELKELGILLALDDFGTGYSSLSYLQDFPVDIIKIDQKFIAELVNDSASRAIVAKTIELAHLLDLVVISEGVETSEQSHEINQLDSDLCQGFFFWEPLSAIALDDVMAPSMIS